MHLILDGTHVFGNSDQRINGDKHAAALELSIYTIELYDVPF